MKYIDEQEKMELGRHLADYLIESGCVTADALEREKNFCKTIDKCVCICYTVYSVYIQNLWRDYGYYFKKFI